MAENQKVPGPITATVESPEAWQRVLKIEITREFFTQEYTKRLKKAAKSFQKPGFRKGHTPKAVVEKELGDAIRMETIEALVPQAWMTGVLEHKLAPITDPALSDMAFPDDGNLSFDLTVEVKPEIEAVGYDNLSAKKRLTEVTDADVDEVLTRLQESRATYEKVERAGEEGDQILLDLLPEAWDGQADAGKKIEDQRFILGSDNNMPAFNEGLLGVSAGDEKAVSVNYPDEHPNENLQGQAITFHCEIKEVAAKVLPELNDEFAASVEPEKTLDDMKQQIQADLTKENEKRVSQEIDEQLLRELVGKNDVPLPPSMVEKYLDSGVEELHRRNLQTGRPNSDEEDQQYRESGRGHAEKALKGMLLLEAVRRQEEIKVTDEDVDARIAEIAAEHGFDVDRYVEFVKSGDEKDRLEYDLLERRTYDFLLKTANLQEVPADTDVLAEEE